MGTRYFNRFEYWEKPVGFIKEGKVNLVSEENQILQTGDFGKFILYLSRIKQFQPDAHIILTIREQRSFLESRYKYQFDWHGGYTKNFDAWLHSGQGMDYLSIAMYHTVYNTIGAFFPAEQIHILLFEDLKSDFTEYFKSVYKILGLKPSLELIQASVVQNKSMSEKELLFIRRINRFKIFKGDNALAKYEFALTKKLAGFFSGTSPFRPTANRAVEVTGNQPGENQINKLPQFRWENIPAHKNIEADFALQNTRLLEVNGMSLEKLRAYNYLLKMETR